MSKYEKRLARLEKRSGKNAIEIWMNIDGKVRGPRGQTMSNSAYKKAFPNSIDFTIDLVNSKEPSFEDD